MSEKNKSADDLRVTPPPKVYTEENSIATKHDVEGLRVAVHKIASAINRSARHIEKIPEIKTRVDSTSNKVIALDIKMEGMTGRVSKIEEKVDKGHDCYQVDIISGIKDAQRDSSQKLDCDTQNNIEQKVIIENLLKNSAKTELEITDIKNTPRRMLYGLLGILVTILMGAGGTIWFLAELSKDVEFERDKREQQFKHIETQIKSVGVRADTTKVTSEIEELERAVRGSNDNMLEFDKICEGMPYSERRYVKTLLSRRGNRIPASCVQ